MVSPYHDDVIGRVAAVFLTGDADRDGIGPVGLRQRGDDEQHEADGATRLARRPAHGHGAEHGRC